MIEVNETKYKEVSQLDENKEFLASENEAESTNTDTTSETTENTAELTEPTENNEDTLLNTEEVSDSVVIKMAPAPKKNKKLIQLPIIIGIVIVAAAAITLFVIKAFFDTSIVGTWIETVPLTSDTSSSDETANFDVYYTFNNDGTLDYTVGTMSWNGTYTVSADDSGNQTLEMVLNGSQTSCNYTVSGNMFTGRTLELSTSSSTTKVDLKSGSVVKPELKVDKDFKANDKVTGTWTYDNGYAKMTYKFNDDGTVEINQSDSIKAEGTYLIKNNTIIIKYYYTDEVEMDVAYSVEKDGLKLNDILYTKDDGSAKATTAAATEAATETATTSAK